MNSLMSPTRDAGLSGDGFIYAQRTPEDAQVDFEESNVQPISLE